VKPPRPQHDVKDILPHALPEPLTPPADFAAKAGEIGVEFDEPDVPRLGAYLALLLTVNETMNLTAIKDPETAWSRHILDSISLIPMLADLDESARVIDVGSGGGLPGIPLAICMPHLRFTLLEATGKKAAFLERAASLLGLSNVDVIHDRAERAAHNRGSREDRSAGTREAFEAVVARAVGRLNSLAEITVPFAKIGGRVLLMKGEKAAEEVIEADTAFKLLNAVFVQTIELPTGKVVVLEKNSATPRIYPRGDGEPTNRPLGPAKHAPKPPRTPDPRDKPE
jgi:16S rRNA (guanine527-N7)-methyltransferase